jgi:hypothetical protein
MGLVGTVALGDWEFHITEQPWALYISAPDCGGMADSLPRVPDQLAWAEQAFAEVPALKQVWQTTWEVTPGALPAPRALFERNGGQWQYQAGDC